MVAQRQRRTRVSRLMLLYAHRSPRGSRRDGDGKSDRSDREESPPRDKRVEDDLEVHAAVFELIARSPQHAARCDTTLHSPPAPIAKYAATAYRRLHEDSHHAAHADDASDTARRRCRDDHSHRVSDSAGDATRYVALYIPAPRSDVVSAQTPRIATPSASRPRHTQRRTLPTSPTTPPTPARGATPRKTSGQHARKAGLRRRSAVTNRSSPHRG